MTEKATSFILTALALILVFVGIVYMLEQFRLTLLTREMLENGTHPLLFGGKPLPQIPTDPNQARQ